MRDRFLEIGKKGQDAILAYLGTLKHPEEPNQDVLDQVQLDPFQQARKPKKKKQRKPILIQPANFDESFINKDKKETETKPETQPEAQQEAPTETPAEVPQDLE